MAEPNWISPKDMMPQNNQNVFWMDSTGRVTEGIYYRNLWWFADKTMYIYYLPKFWRPRL